MVDCRTRRYICRKPRRVRQHRNETISHADRWLTRNLSSMGRYRPGTVASDSPRVEVGVRPPWGSNISARCSWRASRRDACSPGRVSLRHSSCTLLPPQIEDLSSSCVHSIAWHGTYLEHIPHDEEHPGLEFDPDITPWKAALRFAWVMEPWSPAHP